MAAIRLALEIDGDVYPELHAMLSLIASGDAKAERVRQLAASGLVWENVRIYGAAAIGPNAAGASASDAPLPALDAPVAPARPRAAPKVNARGPAKGRRATDGPAAGARGDFVDLAIDAVAPSEELPRVLEREVETMARQIPVLLDVVIPETAAAVKTARQRRAAPTPVPEPLPQPPVPAPEPEPPAVTTESAADAAADGAPSADTTHATLHMDSLAQKPATRSRLMRMKEKGLFKNG